MKVGSMVQINVNNFTGENDQENPFGIVGEVIDHSPEIWTKVEWPNGVISYYDEDELICLDYQEETKIPTVVQPETGFNPVFVARVIAKIDEYHKTYLVEHPHDWDCCGFASVSIEFGRKRKMKEQVQALGFNIAYKSGTDSIMDPTFRIPSCGHQSLTYKEEITKIICEEINNVVGEKIARVSSYMD